MLVSRAVAAALRRPQFVRTFLDLHQFVNKDAIAKEKARLSDELNKGYFADIAAYKKNGGKIAPANKIIIPAAAAVKFPDLEASNSGTTCLKLPITSAEDTSDDSPLKIPSASLICLSFRASAQSMVESWSLPFLDAFSAVDKVQVYEVTFIHYWLLSLSPVKKVFLKMMMKSDNPHRQIIYSFGDHYDIRKSLHIANLVTGFVFLVDNQGRVRWQGTGFATDEEISSLLSCTSTLLDDE